LVPSKLEGKKSWKQRAEVPNPQDVVANHSSGKGPHGRTLVRLRSDGEGKALLIEILLVEESTFSTEQGMDERGCSKS